MKNTNQSVIQHIRKGETVSRVFSGQPMKKEYEFLGYCRSKGAYKLVSVDDATDFMYVDKDTLFVIR